MDELVNNPAAPNAVQLVPAVTFKNALEEESLLTCHYQRKGDHDSTQELVGYGVLFEGVSDGLIVTEETPFERAVLRGQDEKW